MNPMARIIARAGKIYMGQRDKMRMVNQIPPAGVNRRKDIPYIDDDDPMHLLDIYMPMGKKEKRPTIIDVHGGGWVYGSKDTNRNFCRWLSSQGFTVVCPSYRLVPQTDLRGELSDVLAVMRWVAEKGEEYYCDPEQTYMTGDSAGAQLISVATCIDRSPELQEVFGLASAGLHVRALALNHGVFDKDEAERLGGFIAREVGEALMGGDSRSVPWAKKASFPAVAEGLELPPLLVISSEMDTRYTAHTLKLAVDLKARDIPFELLYWSKKEGPKLGHVFNVSWPEWRESEIVNKRMVEFFLEH